MRSYQVLNHCQVCDCILSRSRASQAPSDAVCMRLRWRSLQNLQGVPLGLTHDRQLSRRAFRGGADWATALYSGAKCARLAPGPGRAATALYPRASCFIKCT